MTDQPPIPPQDLPHFEPPPSQWTPHEAVGAEPARPAAPSSRPNAGPARAASSTNPIARRPWVAAAGMAGAVVVAAAAGYGYGRQADAGATSTSSAGTSNGVTVDPGTGTSGIPGSNGGTEQVDPGSGQDPFGGQFSFPGSDDDGQTQVLPGDPSGGFSGQPGTVTPGQGGPTTQSGGS